MRFQKLSIICPAFNEEKTISQVLEKVLSVKIPNDIKKEIIIVNDCSTDNTGKEINNFKSKYPEEIIVYIKHQKNRGKGNAINSALVEATGEYVIIQDSDLEYDPNEYGVLLNPILKGQANVVYGSRFASGKTYSNSNFWHFVGNKFLTKCSNFFSDLNLTDMETCYKVFPTKLAKKISLKEKRFGFEPEITRKLAAIKGIRFYEVGISYFGRTYSQGKKIKWKDGFRALYVIFKYAWYKSKINLNDME